MRLSSAEPAYPSVGGGLPMGTQRLAAVLDLISSCRVESSTEGGVERKGGVAGRVEDGEDWHGDEVTAATRGADGGWPGAA